VVALLATLTACRFLNPLGETQDGSPPRSRLRMAVAAATFETDCSTAYACSVQVELAHSDRQAHRVEVLAVRVLDRKGRGGEVAFAAPLRWRGESYGDWVR